MTQPQLTEIKEETTSLADDLAAVEQSVIETDPQVEEVAEETEKKPEMTVEQQLAEAQAEIAELEDKTEQSIESEAALESLVAVKRERLEVAYQDLIPEGLSIVDEMAYIEKLEAIQPKQQGTVQPERITAIGRPTPVHTENVASISDLTAVQKMAHYFDSK